MLKCEFCGKEFSMKVIRMHQERCKDNPKNKEVKKEVKKEDKKTDKKKVK